jgi:cobalt transporter subunit CbtB
MNTTATATVRSGSRLAPALLAAFFGLAIIFVTGHVQTETLHDAAHDVRHATGFPCH